MSLASLAKLAKATGANGIGKDRLSLGSYALGIKKVWTKKSDKNGHTYFIVLFTVLEAVQTDPTVVPSTVGSDRSASFDLDDQFGYGINDIAALVSAMEGKAVLGADLVATCEAMTGEEQIARGYVVRGEVAHKANKKDPANPFTIMRFGTIPGKNDDVQVKQRRAEFEATGV